MNKKIWTETINFLVEFDFVGYIERQNKWSERTFGEGRKPSSILKHLDKEIKEIREKPFDLMEYIDLGILSFDGAFITGWKPKVLLEDFSIQLRWLWAKKWNFEGIEAIEKIVEMAKVNPYRVENWSRIFLVSLFEAFRKGFTRDQISFAFVHKQSINFGRKWPPGNKEEPTEHVREGEEGEIET